MSSKPLVVASIVAKNYLPRVRVLAASLREHHPELQLQVLLCDQLDGEIDPSNEPFQLVQPNVLELKNLQQFCFRYDLRQRCSALKPFFLEYLLDQQHAAVLFLDPDMLVTAPLTTLLEPLANMPILLTPHLLHATGDAQCLQREMEILRAGIFNAGVIGVAESSVARCFLTWWKQRLHCHTQDSIAEGMYYDQRWLDLVPSLFRPVHIVRDAGCNVAHWNLNERMLSLHGSDPQIAGLTCRLMHFSGYDPAQPERLSQHADWTDSALDTPIRTLMMRYRQLLYSSGQVTAASWQPAWEHFANGLPVAACVRRLYASHNPAKWDPDPFGCTPASFFQWLMQPVDAKNPVITRLWQQLHGQCPELLQRWPDALGQDRQGFATWINMEGWQQYGVAPYQTCLAQ